MEQSTKHKSYERKTMILIRALLFSFVLIISYTSISGQVTGFPNSGQSAAQQCSPAIYDINYKFTFLTPANPTGVVRLVFNLYTSGNVFVSAQSFQPVPIQGAAIKYVERSTTFNIPYTGDCEYFVEILMYYDGVYINAAYQIQRIGIWHIDNQADGVIAINPNIRPVCIGSGLANFRFQDASTFACVVPTGQNPNIIERHVQFIYGTTPSATQGIPNLYINDGTSNIYLTDGAGVRIIFPTASTYYEGPIISTGPFPLGGSQLAYPIFFDGVGTVVNDYFEVTVRNWNFCNPWNGDPVNPNVPVTTSTARIVIVDGPIANAGPDFAICSGGTATMAGSRLGTATSTTWSTSGTGTFANPAVLTTVYTPSAADQTAGFVDLTLTATGGSALCLTHSDVMRLTINPTPAAILGTATVCVGLTTTLTDATPGGTWSSLSPAVATVSAVGDVTGVSGGSAVIRYTLPTGCFAARTVTVNPVPSATISYTGNPWCTTAIPQNVTRTGTAGGTYSATPAGLTLNAGNGRFTPASSTPGTYTITYTIAAAGGCPVFTTTTTVTITALPTATITYAGAPFCRSVATAQPVTLTGTGAYTGGTYSAAPAGLTLNAATGDITPGTSTAGTYTVTYTVPASAGCAAVPATRSVTITAVPTATISYAGTPYCTSLIAAQPVTLTGTGAYTGGTFTAAPAGLTINAATGAVTPGTSTPGTYTVTYVIPASGGCAAVGGITTTVTITQLPSATISYAGTPFCRSIAAPQAVTRTGTAGGTYSAAPAGLSINAASGDITPGTSTAGTYTVTYTIPAGGGCAAVPVTTTVIITAVPTATISYAGTPYCMSILTPQPVTLTGTGAYTGGTYTAAPAGLTINAVTGAVTPSTSTAGTYTVTYVIPASGGCPAVGGITTTVTMTAVPTATISYAGTPFCRSVAAPQPVTITGTGGYAGGTYSSTAGLTINAATGDITPSTSTAGTYTVTYMIPAFGLCPAFPVTTSVTITAVPTAAISYAGTPFCTSVATGQAVTLSGTGAYTGGTYTAAPAGLTINAATGAITPSSSTPGTYTVTYTIPASGGCAAVPVTTTATITLLPSATINYAGTPFCRSLVGAQVVTRTGTAGGTYTSSPAGLTINAATGDITPSTSTAGTYTVTYTIAAGGGCAAVPVTTSVTITAVPTATISYAGTPFCASLITGQAVTLSGTGAYTGGTYSAAPAGLTINGATGAITPSSSTPGTYTVTYTIPASGGCAAVPVTTSVTVTAVPTATIIYAGTPFCTSLITGQAVTLNGTGAFTGGTYTAAPAGLSINAATGAITPGTSTPGTYTVTYTIPASAGCAAVPVTTSVTVTVVPTATISYAGTPFCTSLVAGQAVALSGTGAYTGGTYTAAPAGLTINAATGAITPSSSTAGTYTVTYTIPASGGCAAVPVTTSVTITAVPTATISYAGTPFCRSLSTGQSVTLNGTGAYTGGTYTASPAGLTIIGATGAITPSTSTPGTYTVTYTIPASAGCASVPVTTSVTVTAVPTATISYAGNPFCASVAAAQSVTINGTGAYTGGTYSAAPAGLTINAATGAITPNSSTPGIYTVTYTIPATGGCAAVPVTTTVNITVVPTAAISYPGTPYCTTVSTGQAVTISGTGAYTGGTYSSSPAGLTINSANGAITPSTSTPGTYTVTYTIPASGGCAAVPVTTSLTITLMPTAVLSYAGAPFCTSVATAQPATLTGTGAYGGGTYAAVPAGLSINSSTGAITPGTSTAGTYTITYTIPASAGCASVPVSTTVTITTLPTATISYSGPWCTSEGVQNVTLTGTLGGVFSAAPAGLTINSATGTITPATSTPGTYTVTYTIAAAGGCGVVTATTSVTVNITPTLVITNPAAVCAPGTANLTLAAVTAGSTAGLTFTYFTDPGATVPYATPAAATSGTYYIKGTTAAGCTDVEAVIVTVVPLPTTPAIGGGGKTSMCVGTTGQFYSVPSNPGNTYTWSIVPATTIAGGGTPASNFIALDFPASGTYTLTVQEFTSAPQVCGGPVQTLTITVYNNPVANAGLPKTICEGGSTTIGGAPSATGGSGTYTYLWTPSIGLDDATSPNPVANPNTTRTYTLNVTDVLSGCAPVATSVLVTVNPLPTAYLLTGPDYYCFGTAGVTLTLSGSQIGVDYQLYLNGVSAGPAQLKAGTGLGLNWTNLTTGTYTVRATNTATTCANNMNGSITVAENPDVVITSVTPIQPSCFGMSDGVISIIASGGTGALSYSINGGAVYQSSNTFSGLPQAIYNIVVRDSRLCTETTTETLTAPPALSISSITVTSTIKCFGDANGSARVVVAGGTLPYTYQWYFDSGLTNPVAGKTADEATGLPAGTYWVKITDFNSCWISTSITLTQPTVITATAAVTSNFNGSHISCFGANDAVITTTASGGTGAFSYVLVEQPLNVTGAASGVFTGVAPGTYTVRVTDINLCSKVTLPVTVTQPTAVTGTALVTSNYNGSQISCNGASDGIITVTASGGTGVLAYLLNELPGNVTGAITGVFTGLPPNTYTIRVTDKNGCLINTLPVTIAQPPALTVGSSVTSNYNGSQLSCNGASDGIITATSTGGTGVRSYALVELPANVTGATTGIFTGLPAGSYTVRVSDLNGCTLSAAPVTITPPAVITTAIAITSNYNGARISCFGASDGRIAVTAAGGTGALSYVLNQDPANVTGAASGIFTGLPAGVYSVTVTDVNLCTKITTTVTLNNPLAITATAAVTSNYNGSQLSCSGASDGRITVTASGGTGALSYVLVELPGNVTGAVSGIFTGLPAGTYTVAVTDLNLCSRTTVPVTITAPAVITGTTAVTSNFNGSHISCNGASDAILTVTASGGTGVLRYALVEIPANVTGLNTGVFNGIPAGTYTVSIRDANNCTIVTAPVTVVAPAAVTAVAAVTSNYNGSQISCSGSSDAVITVTASGGTGALTYQIVEAPGNLTGAATGIFTGVGAGTYTVRATDLNGCTIVTLPVTIVAPPVITATGLVTSNYNGSQISCNGASDGRIAITAAGGTGALSYVLNQDPLNVTGAASGIFTGLVAGTYTVTVTDLNGCTKTTPNITVSNPPVVTASAAVTSNYNGSHISCFGASDAVITTTASGGTGAFSYVLVEQPLNVTGAASGVFTGVAPGTYTVRVTDINLCSKVTLPVTVTQPTAVTGTALVTSNYNGSQISCNGASDGIITVTASGGTGVLAYVLNELPGNVTGAITGVFTGLPPNTYTIRVTDKNGCFINTLPVTIAQPPALTVGSSVTSNYNGSQLSCNGASDGIITATSTGGTGVRSYALVELPANVTGAATGIFTGLPAGSYTVRVSDINGCTLSAAPVTITPPAVITTAIAITSNYNGARISCFGASDGRIAVTAAGGTGALSYVLNQDPANVTGAASGIFTGLPAGVYSVTVTDVNLCTKITTTVTLNNPLAITATAAVTSNYNGSQLSCSGASDGRITVTASGGTGALSYVLVELPGNVTGAVSGIFTGLPAGTYTVAVTDLNLCSRTTVPVTITAPAVITGTTAVTSNFNGSHISCNGASDAILTVTASGGTGVLRYALVEIPANVTGLNTGVFNGIPAGTYTVSIRDANNCTIVTAPVTVVAPAAVTAVAAVTSNYNGSQISCSGSSDAVITVTASGGTGALTYQIVEAPGNLTGAATGIFTGVGAGTYTVRATDLNGCTIVTLPVTIVAPPVITATGLVTSNYNGSQISCNGASDGRIAITAAGGTGALSYVLNQDPLNVTGAASGIFTGLVAGTYTVTVTDLNGCTKTTPNITVSNPPVVTASAAVTSNYNGSQITCSGASDGIITVTAGGGTGALNYLLVELPGNVTGAASGVFTGLPAGTYTVTVRDLNLCSKTTLPVTITAPTPVVATMAVTSDYNGSQISCNGASDGRLTVTASGGTGVLKYVLDQIPLNISGLNTGIFTGVPAGNYTVTVTDKNNCTAVTAPVTITQPPAILLSANITSNYNGSRVSCNGASDGVITASASGGTGVLTYTILQMPGNLTGAASGIFTGLPAGTYTIRVYDINNCQVTAPNLVIANPPAITATGAVTSNYNGSHVTCFGASDGRITITAAGGTGALSYVLDQIPANVTGAASGIFTGVPAGNYTVTVTDLNGCTKVTPNITVNNPPAITASAVVTSNYNGSQITCSGASDGRITVTSSGGTGVRTYLLVEIPGNVTGAASGVFTGLPAGTYTVTVTDVNSCNITTTPVTITAPLPVIATAAVTSNYFGSQLSCFGASDGRITVTASGGTGAMAYTLVQIPANVTGAISGVFTGLPAGNYTVTVVDKNSCSIITAPVTITPPPALTLAVNIISNYNGRNISCFGASDGRAEAVVTGGTGSYSYIWYSDPAMTIPIGQLTSTAINLIAGDYFVKVTDVNGCSITGSVILAQPTALDATITAQTNVLCYGNNTGSVTVTATAGTGTAPYQYSIDGGATWQAAGTFNTLAASTYTVLVKDVNSCIKTVTVAITQPTQLLATITSQTNVSCFGGSNGQVTVTPNAGAGTAPYTFSRDGGATWQGTGLFTGLAAGSYNIIVRDANLCTVTIPVVISEPTVLTMTKTPDVLLNCYDDMTATASFFASGGTLPYTFNVDVNTTGGTAAVPGFNSQSVFGAGAGTITVTVTDGKGCTTSATVNITEPPLLTPGSIGSNQVICNADNPAMLTEVTPATGGPAARIFQWQYSNVAGGPFINIAGANASTYTPPSGATMTLYYRRMVTSGLCVPVYSNEVEIIVNPRPVGILSGGETICPGATSILKVNLPLGTGPFTLDIENYPGLTVNNYASDADITVSPLVTTTYKLLRIRDANGCQVIFPSPNMIGSATVTVRALPAITLQPVNKITCEYGMVTYNVTATGSDLTYQWYVKQGAAPFIPIADGGVYFGSQTNALMIFGATRDMDTYVYQAVVTGCATSVTSTNATLTVNTAPEILLQPKDSTICQGANAKFTIAAQGTALVYQWQRFSGGTWNNVTDVAPFSGSATPVLTVTGAPGTLNNAMFRVKLTGTCGTPVFSNFVFLRVNAPPAVTLQPLAKAVCQNGGPVFFTANGSGLIDSLRWQVSINGGGTWNDIYDNAVYSGTTSQQLTLINVPGTYNTYQYRLGLKAFCITTYTNGAVLTVNANPVVNFTAVNPILACGGVPKVLNGNPSGGSGTYSQHTWTGDVGPLNNYFRVDPTFNSQIAGMYKLVYRVKDTNGCSAEDTMRVSVDAPDATFAVDQYFGCTPLPVQFTKDMTGYTSFWWNFGDGSPIESAVASPLHTFTNITAGSIEYRDVELRVMSAGGCEDTYKSSITIYPAVDATFTANRNVVCSGGTITFTSLPGGTYVWDFGDGTSSPGSNVITHQYTNAGPAPAVLTVRLTTTSFYTCTSTSTITVTVMPVPIPNFTAAPVSQIFVAPPTSNPVVFTNTTNAGAWSWNWRFGDGGTSTAMSPSHTYTGIGTFDVWLVVNNANCKDSIRHQVSVTPIPPVPSFANVPSGCAPLYVAINNTSLNVAAPGITYTWDFGDGSPLRHEKNPTYTYFSPGTFRITLTITDTYGVPYQYSQVVDAFASPKAYFQITPTTVYVNDEAVRMFNLSQGANNYVWDFGDGDTSRLVDPYHKYMEEGVYDITLNAYSYDAVTGVTCSDSWTLSPGVTVEPPGVIRFATVFTPDKTGEQEPDVSNIDANNMDNFFYPPIKEEVLNYKLQIFNRWGTLIFQSNDINIPWNGYYKHKLCRQGVYVWYVEGKYANGKPFKKTGDITLLH